MPAERPGRARVSFIVPDEVPAKHTTAQLPPDERAVGHVHVWLYGPDDELVLEGDVDVDADGVLAIPLPDDSAPGRWTLDRGVLVRSMFLLPLERSA